MVALKQCIRMHFAYYSHQKASIVNESLKYIQTVFVVWFISYSKATERRQVIWQMVIMKNLTLEI